MLDSNNLDQIVHDILDDMSPKEKAIIANLDEENIPYLQQAFDSIVDSQIGIDDELAKVVICRVWKALQETHRIRCVK